MTIHQTAVVDKAAEIASGVEIGPYCVVGPHTRIGKGTVIDSHVRISGWTAMGEECRIYSHAAVGGDPQDLKYKGEVSYLRIGARNIVREFVTLNRGSLGGGRETTIGDDNLFMAYSHVAHDSHVGSNVIMGNAATLAGHVTVGDCATINAFSAVIQFCRVGPHAFIGGFSVITRDALPFVKTVGNRNQAKIYGINSIGLQRRGVPDRSIQELKQAYRMLFRTGLNTGDALGQVQAVEWESPEVATLVEFIKSSRQGFIR